MFNGISKLFNMKKAKKENTKEQPVENTKATKTEIPKSIVETKKKLQQAFEKCDDLVIREVEVGKLDVKVIVAFLDGFIDSKILSENVIEPIIEYSGDSKNKKVSITDLLKSNIISSNSLSELGVFEDTIDGIAAGEAIVYIDGAGKALKIGVKSPDKRGVEQSSTEITVKGSKEGFNENLRTNTILLRRRIKSPNFKVENLKLGEQTHTDVNICYIEGIVKEELVEEVKKRIQKIKIDGILSPGYIEQFIQDGKYPIFPMVGNSEKPDKVAAKLLEGRIAIIADGSPTALTVPFLFIECIQSQEDYYGEYIFASFIRILRFMSLVIAIYLPALFVAITAFHQSVLPFKLLLTIISAREGIPFSTFTETFMMIIVFEILREAGIRLPRAIGQAVSIVGAIVLGDAAVSAGIASAPIIIIAALSGICGFIIPPIMKTISIFRFVMLVAANILGLFGIGIISIILISYLSNKRSFGIPYLVPLSPVQTDDFKDTLIVVPIWAMFTRPRSLNEGKNITRSKGKFFSRKGNKP